MIKGLQACPLSFAISADPEIHYSWIKKFWDNSKTKEDSSKIFLKVDNLKVTVTEDVIRKALQIQDNVGDPCTIFTDEHIGDYLEDSGYEAE